jgi:hypothetical protein
MPILCALAPDLNLVYYQAYGDCNGAQVLQAVRQAKQLPQHRAGMRSLFDFQEADELDFDVATLMEGVALLREWHALGCPREQAAFISANRFAGDLVTNFSMMAEEFSPELRVFNHLPTALAWLGLATAVRQVQQVRADLCAQAGRGNA